MHTSQSNEEADVLLWLFSFLVSEKRKLPLLLQEELTPSAEEEVGVRRINTDWYAFCEAIYQGIEGQEWETMYHYKDLQPAVGTKKPGENQKARALWAMKAAKGREEHFMTELIERTTTQRLWRRRCAFTC